MARGTEPPGATGEHHEPLFPTRRTQDAGKRASGVAGGAAAALLPFLEGHSATAQVVPEDDLRLHMEYIHYPGETSEVRAYLARPKGTTGVSELIRGLNHCELGGSFISPSIMYRLLGLIRAFTILTIVSACFCLRWLFSNEPCAGS